MLTTDEILEKVNQYSRLRMKDTEEEAEKTAWVDHQISYYNKQMIMLQEEIDQLILIKQAIINKHCRDKEMENKR